MAECGQALTASNDTIIMEDFRILRPIRIPQARCLKLSAEIESDGIKMSLCADYVRDGRIVRKDIVYAESFYRTTSFSPVVDREIFHDEKMNCFSLPGNDIYLRDFMQSGPFYQGLGRELCFSNTHFRGVVEISPDNFDFLVEPIAVDNCFQLGNIVTGVYNGYAGLPVSIERFCVFNTLPGPEAYCYGMVETYEDHATVQHFIICDESDSVILSASGVRQHYIGKFNFDVLNHIRKAHERTISRSSE